MYATNYTDPRLFDSKEFAKDLTNKNIPTLNVFRDALKHGHDKLKRRFQIQKNATNYVIQRAWLIDQILLRAWQLFIASDINTIALIAVGGYGRGELHPNSDIDLLILTELPMDTAMSENVGRFITFLWDIRFEVGHSVRTMAECEHKAKADITVATNLIEVRLLTGSEFLFQAMQANLAPDRIWPHKKLFAAKIEEQTQRHLKYDDTAYNLEPNIKESPGGLRDIQMIGWVAKRYFDATTLHDLIQHSFLTEQEYQTLIESQEFLWKVRCFLHFTAKRHEDRLLFDYQRSIATSFGYTDDDAGLGVEKLMKRYYRTVKEIGTLNDMLLQLFQEAILYADTNAVVYSLNKRFQVRNDFIEITNDEVFVNYPFALLEIFLLMQQNPQINGVRAATIRSILHSNYLIDSVFRQDLRAQSLFIEIFRQPQRLTHTLRRMNYYGILAAYIPAFGKIVGQMQYDLFHVYTVEQHTLFVVRNLRRFALPEFYHELPFCSQVALSIPKLELLYLAGLFHDIAKGRGGDHSPLGEIEALNFCQAHSLSNRDARLVGWLVRNHLLMSTTAQRQDISNPDVIKMFAQRVGDSVHLDYLYLLTVADIRATSPNLWNNWKDSLLTSLYHKTRAVLHYGKEHVLDKQLHIQNIQWKARGLLNGIYNKHVSILWKKLGDDYFLSSTPQDVVRDTKALLRHGNSDVPIIIKRQYTKGGTEFIVIYTKERDRLFADTAYFLEQHNLTIVDAYIIPTQSKYAIGGYTVLEEKNGKTNLGIDIDKVLEKLKQELIQEDSDSPFCPITRHIPRQLKHFPVPTRVTFSQDHINNHTILELIATDFPGVLSRIAQVLLMCQVRIKKAKIATFGSRVEDIFFITDYENHALYSAKQLDCLRDRLSQSLDESTPTV